MMRFILVMLLVILLNGCSYQELAQQHRRVIIQTNAQLFELDKIDVVSEAAIFELSQSQQKVFLQYFHKKTAQGKLKHEAISDFLLERLDNFSYYGDTLVASDALGKQKGNCMSLAILTTALAKLVGVEYGYREVVTVPVYEKQNNLILSSIHVQTKLFNPESNNTEITSVAGRPGIMVDYFPNGNNIKSRYLRYPQFLAMYYKNIASDALVEGNLNKAFAYANQAYRYDGGNPEVLNLLAVIHRRAGDEQTAEAIYHTAISIDASSISLISNYITLLESQERQSDAKLLKGRIDKLEDTNPYSWLEQAYLAHDTGNWREAESYYKKTLALAPYVNQAYLGLYQLYMAKQQEHRAKATLAQALEWTHNNRERLKLKYKLYGRNRAFELTE